MIFVGSKKKCDFVRPAQSSLGDKIELELLIWDKKVGFESVYEKLEEHLPSNDDALGVLQKEYDSHSSKLVTSFKASLGDKKTVDIVGGLSLCLSVKGSDEMGTLQKSAVLTNKVLKRFFVSFIYWHIIFSLCKRILFYRHFY